MVITELQAETMYSVAVAAYTTKGDGARSKAKLITTTGAGKGTVITDKSPPAPLLMYPVIIPKCICAAESCENCTQ